MNTTRRGVTFNQHIYPAKEYVFSIRMAFPPRRVMIDNKYKMQNRGSESKTIKCYSRPSEITGEYINFQKISKEWVQ